MNTVDFRETVNKYPGTNKTAIFQNLPTKLFQFFWCQAIGMKTYI